MATISGYQSLLSQYLTSISQISEGETVVRSLSTDTDLNPESLSRIQACLQRSQVALYRVDTIARALDSIRVADASLPPSERAAKQFLLDSLSLEKRNDFVKLSRSCSLAQENLWFLSLNFEENPEMILHLTPEMVKAIQVVREKGMFGICEQEVLGGGAFGEVRKVEMLEISPTPLARKTYRGAADHTTLLKGAAKVMHIHSKHVLSPKLIMNGQIYLDLASGSYDKGVESGEVLAHFSSLTEQILRGLSDMEEKKLVHRDIKGDNILLKKNAAGESEAVLVDFDLSRKIGSPVRTVGALYYCPPEFSSVPAADPTHDSWSLGVTLYEALTHISILSTFNPRTGLWEKPTRKDSIVRRRESISQEEIYAKIDAIPTLAFRQPAIEEKLHPFLKNLAEESLHDTWVDLGKKAFFLKHGLAKGATLISSMTSDEKSQAFLTLGREEHKKTFPIDEETFDDFILRTGNEVAITKYGDSFIENFISLHAKQIEKNTKMLLRNLLQIDKAKRMKPTEANYHHFHIGRMFIDAASKITKMGKKWIARRRAAGIIPPVRSAPPINYGMPLSPAIPTGSTPLSDTRAAVTISYSALRVVDRDSYAAALPAYPGSTDSESSYEALHTESYTAAPSSTGTPSSPEGYDALPVSREEVYTGVPPEVYTSGSEELYDSLESLSYTSGPLTAPTQSHQREVYTTGTDFAAEAESIAADAFIGIVED